MQLEYLKDEDTRGRIYYSSRQKQWACPLIFESQAGNWEIFGGWRWVGVKRPSCHAARVQNPLQSIIIYQKFKYHVFEVFSKILESWSLMALNSLLQGPHQQFPSLLRPVRYPRASRMRTVNKYSEGLMQPYLCTHHPKHHHSSCCPLPAENDPHTKLACHLKERILVPGPFPAGRSIKDYENSIKHCACMN